MVSQMPLRAVNAIESASSPDDEDVRMETECDASSPSTSFGDGPGTHAAFHAHRLHSHSVVEVLVGK